MIGQSYWTTGIVLQWRGEKWALWLDFYDDGWCNEESTEGRLRIRYQVETATLSHAIDTLISDARRIGVDFKRTEGFAPHLYVPGDGEWPHETYHPEWRSILSEQCARLGWEDPYAKYADLAYPRHPIRHLPVVS